MSSDMTDTDATDIDEPIEGEEKKQPLDLKVEIEANGACQRHITVTVSREDIDRYFEKAFSKLMPDAQVPGFRAGRAPRKLVRSRFRKDVSQQVRGEILMDAVGQVTEDQKLAAISEPDFDPMAIEIPDEGPMTFEFDLEVRPEFDMPDWKGLAIDRPTREFTDDDVESRMNELLSEHAQQVHKDGPAEIGDYVSLDIIVKDGERTIHTTEEEIVRVLQTLSFRDGSVKDFGKLMTGVTPSETREATIRLSRDAANEELRGQEVTIEFKVLEVRRLKLPELTPSLLEEIGVESEEKLREAVKTSMERQLAYQRDRGVRGQITSALVQTADWDLPPEMLDRQADRELQRSVLELRRSGFSEPQIRAHENELRQNSRTETARALKEHFILERVAEVEKIDAEPSDYDDEIALIADQLKDSPRRVRARMEKDGQMDAIRNQIIERKVIDAILEHAKFTDTPYDLPHPEVEAIDQSAGGGDIEHDIPEAQKEALAEGGPVELEARASER